MYVVFCDPFFYSISPFLNIKHKITNINTRRKNNKNTPMTKTTRTTKTYISIHTHTYYPPHHRTHNHPCKNLNGICSSKYKEKLMKRFIKMTFKRPTANTTANTLTLNTLHFCRFNARLHGINK